MGFQFKQCEGCDDGDEPYDHIHQYIGGRGDAVITYMIDGIAYTSPSDAIAYVMATYEVDRSEANDFLLKKLPRKYK